MTNYKVATDAEAPVVQRELLRTMRLPRPPFTTRAVETLVNSDDGNVAFVFEEEYGLTFRASTWDVDDETLQVLSEDVMDLGTLPPGTWQPQDVAPDFEPPALDTDMRIFPASNATLSDCTANLQQAIDDANGREWVRLAVPPTGEAYKVTTLSLRPTGAKLFAERRVGVRGIDATGVSGVIGGSGEVYLKNLAVDARQEPYRWAIRYSGGSNARFDNVLALGGTDACWVIDGAFRSIWNECGATGPSARAYWIIGGNSVVFVRSGSQECDTAYECIGGAAGLTRSGLGLPVGSQDAITTAGIVWIEKPTIEPPMSIAAWIRGVEGGRIQDVYVEAAPHGVRLSDGTHGFDVHKIRNATGGSSNYTVVLEQCHDVEVKRCTGPVGSGGVLVYSMGTGSSDPATILSQQAIDVLRCRVDSRISKASLPLTYAGS